MRVCGGGFAGAGVCGGCFGCGCGWVGAGVGVCVCVGDCGLKGLRVRVGGVGVRPGRSGSGVCHGQRVTSASQNTHTHTHAHMPPRITCARTQVLNPATGAVIATLPRMRADETRAAIAAAHSVLPQWRATPARERAAILRRWEVWSVGGGGGGSGKVGEVGRENGEMWALVAFAWREARDTAAPRATTPLRLCVCLYLCLRVSYLSFVNVCRWHDLILQHQSDIAALMTAECGKPTAEALAEIAGG